jgi:Predicted membrane protein (DUF2254)
MDGDYARLLRMVFIIAGCIVLLICFETALELGRSGRPLSELFAFAPIDLRNFVNALNRTFNQLLAIVFTTVAIAVPLTANMYSVKLLEMFIRDKVNLVVLALFVAGVPNNLWLLHNTKETYAPLFQVYFGLAMGILYPAVLIPYLYYVFRFLHPSHLLWKLEGELRSEIRAVARESAEAPPFARAVPGARAVATLFEHISSVGVRSIERLDRSTAFETVAALRRALDDYWTVKDRLPEAWFAAEPSSFRGVSKQALAEMSGSRRWFEMKALEQLREMLSAASPRVHDVVGAIAAALNDLGLSEEARKDPYLEELAVEYFNTFLRLTLNRRDARSAFVLFEHYRNYAEGLCDHRPELALEVAYYFQYYAQVARAQGMSFVIEVAAHDLGRLVRFAWDNELPNRDKLLERFLAFDRDYEGAPLPGLNKAQAILGGYFLLSGRSDQARQVARSLQGLPPAFLDTIRDDLAHVRRERYWEVNDRRINLDYVSEEHRTRIAEFFASLEPLRSKA